MPHLLQEIGTLPSHLITLENRLLLDAAGAAAGAAAGVAAQPAATETQPTQPTQPTEAPQHATTAATSAEASAETSTEASAATIAPSGPWLAAISDANGAPPPPPKAIVFIERNVTDYQTLLKDIQINAEVVLLDPHQDGLEQITAVLTKESQAGQEFNAVYIVAHGTDGQLNLGTGGLTITSMQGQYADELSIIKSTLNQLDGSKADIFIYGCNFAAGNTDTVSYLAYATGTNVAASDGLLGYAQLGGNWILDVTQGTITQPTLFDAAITADYHFLLSPPAIDLNTDPWVSDNFSSGGFSGEGLNDTSLWIGPWVKFDSSGNQDPTTGGVAVISPIPYNSDPGVVFSTSDTVFETLTRQVNLSGLTNATISFDYSTDTDFEFAPDYFSVEVSTDGHTFTQLATYGDVNPNVVHETVTIPTADLTATTYIRFASLDINDNGPGLYLQNISIDTTDFATTYNKITAIPITLANNANSSVTDSTSISSLDFSETNWTPGDRLHVDGTTIVLINGNSGITNDNGFSYSVTISGNTADIFFLAPYNEPAGGYSIPPSIVQTIVANATFDSVNLDPSINFNTRTFALQLTDLNELPSNIATSFITIIPSAKPTPTPTPTATSTTINTSADFPYYLPEIVFIEPTTLSSPSTIELPIPRIIVIENPVTISMHGSELPVITENPQIQLTDLENSSNVSHETATAIQESTVTHTIPTEQHSIFANEAVPFASLFNEEDFYSPIPFVLETCWQKLASDLTSGAAPLAVPTARSAPLH